MVAMVVNYRDRVTDEEVKTQLIDFKNTITKIVYDDITEGIYTSIKSCGDMCIKFVGSEENKLEIITEFGDSGISKGYYFEYKGIKYFVPDSDLNDIVVGEYMVIVNNPIFSSDNVNNIYSVKIPIYHNGMDEYQIIQLTVTNYEID